MELDSIDKYIHMTKLAQGVEVMFAGQPCLKITEGLDSYVWAIYPVFAKLTYGANIFEDVPYCAENFDTMEEAIADGLAKLHSLGAFVGEVDLPEDTYAETGVTESVEELDEGIGDIVKGIKRKIAGKQSPKEVEHTYARMARSAIKHKTPDQADKAIDRFTRVSKVVSPDAFPPNYKAPKRATNEEILDSILQDCRAYATKHSNSIMEAHDLSVGLFESILAEADYSGVVADAKRAGKTHKQMADDHRKYAASMKSLGKNGLAARSEALAKEHEAAEKMNEETLDEAHKLGDKVKVVGGSGKGITGTIGEIRHGAHKTAAKTYTVFHGKSDAIQVPKEHIRKIVEETLDEAKALSGDAYWKSKEDAAAEEKAKANRASAGIKEPEKKGRGKPTLGATVDEMKDRMRENIAAGKRPHTGFDRNEKLRILRSGAMEHPEFAGTHVKAAGRPVGTTKAAAIEKKKAEPTAFSMWAGLGKK